MSCMSGYEFQQNAWSPHQSPQVLHQCNNVIMYKTSQRKCKFMHKMLKDCQKHMVSAQYLLVLVNEWGSDKLSVFVHTQISGDNVGKNIYKTNNAGHYLVNNCQRLNKNIPILPMGIFFTFCKQKLPSPELVSINYERGALKFGQKSPTKCWLFWDWDGEKEEHVQTLKGLPPEGV